MANETTGGGCVRGDANELGSSHIDLAQFGGVGRACRVTGSSNEALLGALVRKVGDVLEAGVEPKDVCVVCASPQAALAFAARLERGLVDRGFDGGVACGVKVSSAREVALGVIAEPEACAVTCRDFSGKKPRVLLPYERDIVMEDLKTWGSRPGRLRKMLDFMYRGFTELADMNPSWLFVVEELAVRDRLVADLRYLGAVIEPEISNLACRALLGNGALRTRCSSAHVFVAGYQNISRASQLMCHLLAGSSLTVAANPQACIEVYESYPYAAGVEEFLTIHPAAVCEEVQGGLACERASRWSWNDLSAEIEGIASSLAAAVGEGDDPARTAVVCFDRTWHSRIARALERRGVPVCGLYEPLGLRGDFSQVARSLAIRIATALRIVADGRDSAAWRCWLGFDDALAHSGEFEAMRDAALERDPCAHFAEDVEGWDGYAASRRFFDTCRGKTGAELLTYVAWALTGDESAQVPSPIAPLLRLGPKATAAQMVEWIDRNQLEACYAPNGGVTVCSLPMLEGQTFDRVVVAGFVNGMLPAHDYFDMAASSPARRKKMEEADAAKVRHLLAAASQEVVASCFERAEMTEAQRYGIKVDRVVFDEKTDRRMAVVSPSVLLEGVTD